MRFLNVLLMLISSMVIAADSACVILAYVEPPQGNHDLE